MLHAEDEAGCTPLLDASVLGKTAAVECLLELGASSDTRDTVRGWTAVHYSSLKGWTETTRVLLDANKGLVNAKTPGDKKTPLDLAAGQYKKDTVTLLKSYGGSNGAGGFLMVCCGNLP